VLIGVVGGDGRLGPVSPALPVDAEFVAAARNGRVPESRFRFSEPCAEQACAQWDDDGCGLIGQLLASPQAGAVTAGAVGPPLPHCAIRRTCRWFAQEGTAACRVCPHVVHTPRRPDA